MKKFIISTGLALAVATTLTSCDDFLDKDPSKTSNKTITSVDQLDALLATYSVLYSESNYTFMATDDYGLTPEIEKVRTSHTSKDDLDLFTWTGTCDRSARNLWDGEYSKIFRANLVLANAGSVSGSEEDKAFVTAEAHLLRAYSMFQLAVCHCLYPSEANADELGLPLKATTSFEESVARRSLSETFRFIEDDITEALKISKKIKVNGVLQNWRASEAAVKAFAARFYLYMGDMTLAKKYADEVLAEYSELKDFNDPAEMYHHDVPDTYTINMGTPEERTVTVKYPYTKLQFYGTNGFAELLGWKELLYARTMTYASWWFIPSRGLADAYGRDIKDGNADNDLRYRYFYLENFGLRNCVRTDAGCQPGYCQFYYDNLISGPTTAEMYLIRAEVLARSGDSNGAMKELNTLRRSRIATDAYEALTASSAADAVKKVLDERRREMPFTIRWYDIKRYNANSDPSDDVTVRHPFYPYNASTVQTGDAIIDHVLEPGSRYFALPLPTVDIMRSDNVLVQNKY